MDDARCSLVGLKHVEGSHLDVALLAAQRGEERAFSVLWRAMNPRLLRYLQVLSPALAEDAAAETWLAVVARLREFDGDAGAFCGWICTIGRNKITDERRRAARRPAHPVGDWTGLEPIDPVDVAALAMERLSTRDVVRLLGRLPADQAEIVALRVLAGLDAAAVGAVVGRSAGAVRVAQHRGLRRLNELLQHERVLKGELASLHPIAP